MTTPTGTIKFSDITAEFGSSPNKKLGEYRVNQTIAEKNWPLDIGIPTSNTIRFSDLRGKTLNIVVDYSGPEEYNVNARTKYLNSGQVVGGYKDLSSADSSTKKVYNIIRKTIGGSLSDGIALRSGTWDTNTISLNFIITSSGEIIGRGGNGANGVAASYGKFQYPSAGNGGSGSPALATSYPCSILIESGGRIQGGGGGGGGGGGAACNPDDNQQDPVAGGGGGGGGAGLPAGLAGSIGPKDGGTSGGSSASNGTKYAGGNGGNGYTTYNVQGPRDCAYGGGGGGGGGPTAGNGGAEGTRGRCSSPTSQNGSNGSLNAGGNGGQGNVCQSGPGWGWSAGGQGGANGFGIVYSQNVNVDITNQGTYFGGSGQGSF